MSKKHLGSSIDDFLKEEGIFEEAQAQAIKEVVAWQLAEAMREKKTADAPAQLEYAAQLLRQRSASGSAKVIANGLAQAANQVTGNAIPLESTLSSVSCKLS